MKNKVAPLARTNNNFGKNFKKLFLRDWMLYLMFLPGVAIIILFNYVPMYGIQIAFKDFRFRDGILGSAWVGFEHFERMFKMESFWLALKNTFLIQVYGLVAGFPAPIILAILLNECIFPRFKKTVQMISYAPNFISTVVICGMIFLFTNQKTGMINNIIAWLGGERIDFMTKASAFKSVFVLSGIWQGLGFASVIYVAALSGVDHELVEAAVVDGISRFKKIWYIDLPVLLPTIIIQLIFTLGNMLGVGYEKVYLLQNPLNMPESDVISTLTYRLGLIGGQYSFTTAIGLFNSVVNFVLLAFFNFLARKMTGTSLW